MNKKQFLEILENGEQTIFESDIFIGLQIMGKYIKNINVDAVSHDELFSCNIDYLIEANITEEDAKKLSELGWREYEDSMAHFV